MNTCRAIAEIRADNYRSSLRNKLVAEGFYPVNAIEKYGKRPAKIPKDPAAAMNLKPSLAACGVNFVVQALRRVGCMRHGRQSGYATGRIECA